MIEYIIEWSSKNRFLVLAAYLLIAGFGIYSAANLPVDAIPDLSENQVIVFTEWMGRSPQIVEDQVTYPIVTALQGLPQVKAVRASSMFGMSFVFVIFDENTDTYFARTRVLEKLNTMKNTLPAGVTPTLGPDGTGVGHVYWYTVESDNLDLGSLRSIQDWYIRYKLASVEGVSEVASIGGFIKQYQVNIDPNKLRGYNITTSDVVTAIQRSNNETGGKLIEQSDAEYFVRGQGYITSASDIENIIIAGGTGSGSNGSFGSGGLNGTGSQSGSGTPVYIKNIATVQIGGDIRRGSLEKNGTGEAVGGIVVMRTGENARDVIERIKLKIEEITPGLPEGVRIVAAYDRSTLIKEAVGTLERALIEAGIVVAIMVAIFLLHFRSIIRIIIEIPVAVLLSFIFMYSFGITSNIMSLGGIILAIGVIVDASIVMVENAYRNIAKELSDKGELTADDYKRISINSAKQVGRAIFFSELIILVSFLPVFLLTGQEGRLFKPLAFTKSFVMFSSAVVVITLIPVLMTFLMRGNFRRENENPVTRFFNRLYEPVIHWVLRWRKTTIAINIVALLITVPMILTTGSEFMPPLDEGSILYMPVTLPNASITEVNRILQLQDKIIKSVPEVDLVLGKAGRADTPTDNAPLSMIETIIILKPKDQWRAGLTKNDIIQELDRKLQIPGVRNGWTQPIINRINMLATGVRTDIGFKIFGDNLDTLEYYAIVAEELLKSVNGAADVVADRVQNGYYIDIKIKREAAARYGMNIGDIQDIIETAIGGENLGVVIEGRMRFPIRMRYERSSRNNIEDLKRLIVPVNSGGSSGGDGMSGAYLDHNSIEKSRDEMDRNKPGGSDELALLEDQKLGTESLNNMDETKFVFAGGIQNEVSNASDKVDFEFAGLMDEEQEDGMGSSNSGIQNGSQGMGGNNSSGNSGSGQNGYGESSIYNADGNNESGSVLYVPLSWLADINVVTGPPMINSENGSLRSLVYMNARGRDMGSVMEDAQQIIKDKLKLPEGYTYSWSGQYESKIRAQQTITIIMPVVFLLIFLLLYFTLRDYKEAGVVMLSVPFALIGGMYMVWILDYNFSVAVWVGFIALYGIAVETGVVMVVYLHEALDRKIKEHLTGDRKEITNADIHEAAIEGSVLRLRPKLMTVFTSMIGLIPIMWAAGTGSDVMKPLTAPMIGGLLTSAVHVLVVTPVLFVMMKERALKKGKLELSRMANFMKEDAK